MEEWVKVVGFEDFYKVNQNGDVMSVNYKDWNYSKLLTPDLLITGYLRVRLCNRGNSKRFQIHRLVAIAFIPNPENRPFVNHKDGNKLNNHVSNLEWCTAKENTRHAVDTGLFRPNCNHFRKTIIQLQEDGTPIKEWESMQEATRQLGISQANISNVCVGKRRVAGGFKWKFKTKENGGPLDGVNQE